MKNENEIKQGSKYLNENSAVWTKGRGTKIQASENTKNSRTKMQGEPAGVVELETGVSANGGV